MGVEFNCPKCQRVLDSDDRAEPDRIVCAGCGARIKVKVQASPPPAAPAPKPQVARRYVPPVAAAAGPDDGGFEVVGDAPDTSHGYEVIDEPSPPRPDDTPRPRKSSKSGKSGKPARRPATASHGPPRKLVVGLGTGVAALAFVACGLVALLSGESDGGGRVQAVAKARPVTPPPVKPGKPALEVPAFAPGWAVTPDPVPVATGLKSAVSAAPGGGVSDCNFLSAYADPAAGCLATGLFRGGVTVVDLRGADSRVVFPADKNRTLHAVALSPTGDRVAVVSCDSPDTGPWGYYLNLAATADGRSLWRVPIPRRDVNQFWVGSPPTAAC